MGVRTAAHRLESGLVRLARRGTSALSKRRGEALEPLVPISQNS